MKFITVALAAGGLLSSVIAADVGGSHGLIARNADPGVIGIPAYNRDHLTARSLEKRVTTEADVHKAFDALDAKLKKCEGLKEELANLTPGSSKKAELQRQFDACTNAAVQLQARAHRLLDQHQRGV